MRQLLLIVFLGYNLYAWSQGSGHVPGKKSDLSNEEWDISKYIWSHTHPASKKNDKPVLDFNSLENWESLGPDNDLSISNDGCYFAYSFTQSKFRIRDTLVIKSIKNNWKRSFAGADPGFFSADNKQYIFKGNNNLWFLGLGTDELLKIENIGNYKYPKNNKKIEWIAYQLKNSGTIKYQNLITGKKLEFDSVSMYNIDNSGQWLSVQLKNELKDLIIYNPTTEQQFRFQLVQDYLFDVNGKVLVLKTIEKQGDKVLLKLQYFNLLNGISYIIWSTSDINERLISYTIDGTSDQIAFIVQMPDVGSGTQSKFNKNSVWYWRVGMDKAIIKVEPDNSVIDTNFSIQNAVFTNNDRHVLITLQAEAKILPAPNPNSVRVDVWSSRDTVLQSTQSYLIKNSSLITYTAFIECNGSRVDRLEKGAERIKMKLNNYVIVGKSGKDIYGDRFWENGYEVDSNWIVSLIDGSRTFIKTSKLYTDEIWISPGGKYLLFFDAEKQCNYFSYNLQMGKLVNISTMVPAWQLGYEDRYYIEPQKRPNKNAGIAGWLAGDSGVLVYDNYDILLLDLNGKKRPVNITNGFGRRNQIKFMITGSGEFGQNESAGTLVLDSGVPLLLRTFNIVNKYHGLYHKVLGKAGDPDLLFTGHYLQEMLPLSTDDVKKNSIVKKAVDVKAWIIKRQSPTEAPNYFITNDFKSYTRLTHIEPQKKFNWLFAELHRFKQLDGTMGQGLMYKPENFNPMTKYPVIVAFYSQSTWRMNIFPAPDFINSPVSCLNKPAWLVSHGFLVFVPDIYFTKGQIGECAFNAVEGAAKYLRSLNFVDGNRMGAVGHSHSGRLAYYLLTHSHSFAAISIGAGTSDFISSALSLYVGRQEQSRLQLSSQRMGNIWENTESWLSESPIMHVNKVTTPFLMFHNKNDAVPYNQAVEMFIALRRMDKKGWWLQYDDGDHVVGGKDEKDFTIRYTQFFDHYLKQAPPPRWMTQGIPYKLKGIQTRYGLDTTGSCGKGCQVCARISKYRN